MHQMISFHIEREMNNTDCTDQMNKGKKWIVTNEIFQQSILLELIPSTSFVTFHLQH